MRTRNIARTGVLNLVAQVVVLAVLYFAAHERPLAATGVSRALVLLVATLVPSAIWAAFFYLQDRRQPEPTANVVMAFAAGVGAAAAVLVPAEAALFHIGDWMYRSPASLALGATLVRGALVATLFYAIIRYGFMPADEFDEPADGMAYGAFAGSGLAAAWSLAQAARHPDFTLFSIAYSGAINVLVYASIGALTGYMVGRAKFQLRPAGYSYAEAILAGAALTGLYHVLAEYAFVEESANAMWISVAAALIFSMVVLGLATWLMYRLTSRSQHRSRPATRRLDPLALVTIAALLAAGSAVTWRAVRPVAFESGGLSFRYDSRFIPAMGAGPSRDAPVTQASFGRGRAIAAATGAPVFIASGPEGARLTIRTHAARVSIDQLDPLPFLGVEKPSVLTITEVLAGGRRALRVRYAYITSRTPVTAGPPEARWAVVDVVAAETGTYVFALDAPAAAFARAERAYDDLLASVSWPNR